MTLGAGVPPPVISRQLGHPSPLITATIHAHRARDDHVEAVACAERSKRSFVGKVVAGSIATPRDCS